VEKLKNTPSFPLKIIPFMWWFGKIC